MPLDHKHHLKKPSEQTLFRALLKGYIQIVFSSDAINGHY